MTHGAEPGQGFGEDTTELSDLAATAGDLPATLNERGVALLDKNLSLAPQ